MVYDKYNKHIFSWGIKILIPSLLCLTLFVVVSFVIEIPAIKNNYLKLKREMIANLVENAIDVLAFFHDMETSGEMTRKEAQHAAINQISKMRYGPEKKDYFWINDLVPKMVMHPYRRDLDGTDISGFVDLNGKQLFCEFVKTVKYNDQGFVDYMWQWKDDPSKIVPKLSFVKEFKPWGWIVGTGIYIEDVQAEIAREINKLLGFSVVLFIFVLGLSLFVILQTYQMESNRSKAEKSLLESHDEYKSLVENIDLGIFNLSYPDEKLIKVNSAFAKMFGFDSKKQIFNFKLSDLYYDARQKEMFFNSALKNPLIKNMECVFKRKDGTVFDGVINAKAKYNDNDELIRINGVIEDISERKKMEDERHRLMKTIEAKNAELENIVSISYHDLRSPLTNIEGFSAVMEEYCRELREYVYSLELPAKVRQEISFLIEEAIMMALERISFDVKKMERLIEGLLKISRIGRSQLNLQQIDMNKLIQTIFEEFGDSANKTSLKIDIKNLPHCYSDPQLVYKIFYHLIDNAIKYLDPNKKGHIIISGKRNDSECIFSVQDNGIGISLAYQKKVFEIFHRLNPDSNVAGEGLGLTIVQMILHRIDGSIWFESNCHEGSTFFVSLPASKKALYAAAEYRS